ncbi:hypothetical protein KO498_13570 [Lentibacter algarum]|uniref:hypothetical protein n=1 Tax=Lentibacter algarum TaxID=576131 RepID=UPI001C07FD8C|nr:hypothetical protein [Lentibacter algarum]MBU2982841.1 hypothetical protein [Lentibacter algarum]
MALLSNFTQRKTKARKARAQAAKHAEDEHKPDAKLANQPKPVSHHPARHFALALETQLVLPLSEDPPEESCRIRVQDRGQFLSRQERWEELSREIRSTDNRKVATHCGMPHADLLSLGARTDVVLAAEQAIIDGQSPSLDGIEALEEVLAEFSNDYAIASIVAQAHMDIGWAWRGSDWNHEIAKRNQQLFEAHFARAREILTSFEATTRVSPLLASSSCSLVVAHEQPALQIGNAYERLIDLNPQNTAPMRTLGNLLLPRWFGDYEALELEARRTAGRGRDTWGNGGYAWVYLDALRVDQGAARALDVDFFLDGLRDILYLQPDQHIANLLAAYTGITMAPSRTPIEAPDVVRDVRQAIHSMFDVILRDNLKELHPLLWAEADLGPDPGTFLPPRSALLRKGHDTARNAIAHHFISEIRSGFTLKFGNSGLSLVPSS